jgi:hypothetical protein
MFLCMTAGDSEAAVTKCPPVERIRTVKRPSEKSACVRRSTDSRARDDRICD